MDQDLTVFLFHATNEGEKRNIGVSLSCKFLSKKVVVNNRLAQLGWSRGELNEVISAMVAARNSCTDNDPIGSPGWLSWKEGARRFREIGLPKKLEKSDDQQIPWVVDNKRGNRFTVCNTDDGTGIESLTPQNRSKKGVATSHVISSNQCSFSFFETAQRDNSIIKLSPIKDTLVSWYLCVYHEGDIVRAELSCPVKLEGGFFTEFEERLILFNSEDGPLPMEQNETRDEAQEFDIPISRK